MNVITSGAPMEIVVIGLQPGEMLLESITQAVREHGIENGVVISGIGTLKRCHMHFIEHTEFPSRDRFYTVEKPLELLSVSGVIAEGEPHLHVVVSCKDQEVYAGHLEESSEVAYLAEIAVLKCNALRLARHLDPTRKIRLLGRKA